MRGKREREDRTARILMDSEEHRQAKSVDAKNPAWPGFSV